MINVIPKPNYVKELGGTKKFDITKVQYIIDENIAKSGYELEITNEKTQVKFSDESGKFNANKTLEQLVYANKIKLVRIKDQPAFDYRGFMVDSSRHMQTIEELKIFIEAASCYKFNKFHWHLSDDQGFRFEIEKYPLLNEIGSYRDKTGFGIDDGIRYGGFYTKSQMKEIVKFCDERCIEVIPEFDIPGHVVSLISAYPFLSCEEKQLSVETKAGVRKNILCVGKESVFEFVFNVLDEIIEVFPSPYIHIGGDEVPKDKWKNCENCQKRMRDEGLETEEQLQGYFTNRVVRYLSEKGKKCIAWNESINSNMLDKSVTIAKWKDGNQRVDAWKAQGGKVIVEEFYNLYLDYPYVMTPLKKTYGYSAFKDFVNLDNKECIIGIETPIWTEYVRDLDYMSYMCYPRMLAAAEIAWTNESEKDYQSFLIRAQAQRVPLEKIGVKMAEKSHWDPSPLKRLFGTIKHFNNAWTKEVVKDFLTNAD